MFLAGAGTGTFRMADIERTLLEHYKLSSLNPVEWPADKNDGEQLEEEDALVPKAHSSKAKRRYTTLQLTSKPQPTASSSPGGPSASSKVIQKDEPDPLGSMDSVVRALRQRGLPVQEDADLRNRFMLSSTTFSPSLYLSSVHDNASTDDLLRGLDFLSKSIEKKSASLKVLVESNFERFVRAKSTIDNVYTEMRNHGAEPEQAPRRHSRHTSRTSTHSRNLSGSFAPGMNRSLHLEKRKNALIKESEFGVWGVKAPLLDATVKAEEVWGPALGGRDREESLKQVLESIEKNRAIFELGTSIEDAIKRRDHDALADDYQKAHRHASEARDLADRSKRSGGRLTDPEIHQILITARVWMDIEKRVAEFKRELWKKLAETHFRSKLSPQADNKGEEYMEIIAILIQLGVEDNPVLMWLSSQTEYLRNKISFFFERGRMEIEIARRNLATSTKTTKKALAIYIKNISDTRLTQDMTHLDTQSVIRFWEQVFVSLNNLLGTPDGILGEFVEFVDISRAFLEGKKQKGLPLGLAGKTQNFSQISVEDGRAIKTNILDLVSLFRDQVQGLFVDPPVEDVSSIFTPVSSTPIAQTPITPTSATLSPTNYTRFNLRTEDMPPPSPKTGEWWESYAFWPPIGNSSCGANYLSKIVTTIATAAGELASIESVRSESSIISQLRNLVGDVRERSITAITNAWLADSERCDEIEDWTRSRDKKDVTNLPSMFTAWESNMLSHLQKIVYISDAVGGSGSTLVVVPLPQRLIDAVQKSFRNSLYKAFARIFEHSKVSTSLNSSLDNDGLTVPLMADPASTAKADGIDASSSDVRKLLTMSNFQNLRSDSIPFLVQQFETNFLLTITEDDKTLRSSLAQMYKRVFASFAKPTDDKLKSIIAKGIESSHTLPSPPAHPTDARPYVYDVLLTLVLLHTTVTTITPSLTGQVLSHFLERISEHLLNSLKLRPIKYDLPSLMQATLDVEFISQTLSVYTTSEASEFQSRIYQALDERTDNDARAKLQMELKEMKRVLRGLREGTKGAFGCFRREKKSAGRDSSKEGGTTSGLNQQTAMGK